jgi:hydrogenase-4 component B
MGSYFIIPQYLYNPVLEMTTGINVNGSADLMTQMIMIITIILSAILLLIGISLLLYKFFVKTDDSVQVGTWDCGYSKPLPSMQYTSSSFASPAIKYVSFLMGFKIDKKSDSRIFPASGWSFKSTVNDWILTRIYEPFTAYTARVLRTPRFLQNGKTGAYVLYIAVTIISLIVWMFGFGS